MKSPKKQKICSRCVADTTIPNIQFDKKGVCNFCYVHDEMEKEYPQGREGQKKLAKIVAEIKEAGKGKKYNCVVGVSGGRDSTYLLYMATKLGLKPLAVHFDNGWDSEIAVSNIKNALASLNLDLETYVVNWEEFKDLQISFLKASVSDAEIPTDVGILGILYRVAAKENIKYVLNGHSFRTEGVMPLEWTYMDGRYIKSVQDKFGHLPLKTFPNFSWWDLFYFTFIKRIKIVPLLNLVSYKHSVTQKILTEKVGWRYYGGHHHESYYTNFFQSYYLNKKFGIDKRKIEYSALIRSGQMKRKQALAEIKKTPYPYDEETVNYIISKLWLTKAAFLKIMKNPNKSFRDYQTYYPIIKKFKIPARFLYRRGFFPRLLYQKFFPEEIR